MTVNELIASLEIMKKTCECDVGELEVKLESLEEHIVTPYYCFDTIQITTYQKETFLVIS